MSLRTAISAVLDEKMATFLSDIRELGRVQSGNAKCAVCKSTVTLETIALVVPAGNHVDYVCDKELCMMKFALVEK